MENRPEEWECLHWVTKRNARASVEALVTQGLVSEAEIKKYRAHDEYLEKATWVGLFISAVLLLAIVGLKWVISILR